MQSPLLDARARAGAFGVLFAATVLLAAPIAWSFPVLVSVKITCGTKSCTINMKFDTAADGATMSRENAIACGLLKADGSKKDAADWDPDESFKNANGTSITYYVTKPCELEATDSFGAKCKVVVPVVVPSQGGPNVSNLLGNTWIGQVCQSSEKNTCKIKWQENWAPPPAPRKIEPAPDLPTPRDRRRRFLEGEAEEMLCNWVHGTAGDQIILGNALAVSLGLSGPPVNLQLSDPELFASLSFGGFLGDNPSIPFEQATLNSFSVGNGVNRIVSAGPVSVLINRQSDENILMQSVLEQMVDVWTTYMQYPDNAVYVTPVGEATPYRPAQVPDKAASDPWHEIACLPTASAGTTVLYTQSFDLGASCTSAGWTSVDLSGSYGNYMALLPGTAQVQQDPYAGDLSCVWAAINGSTETYACGGFPVQKAVPKGNAGGEYIRNEIWSPNIALAGVGSRVSLRFSVYRDLALDGLVFYTWRVRDIVGGIPGPWKDRGLVYYGGQKDWTVHTEAMGDLIRLGTATHVQIALGARDMCEAWCGVYGTGACHSHAPLIDTVKLYRIDSSGPQWSIRDIDQFQDSFAEVVGSGAGSVRADAAMNTWLDWNFIPGIQPGDSAVVRVVDPVSGIDTDPTYGGPAVYIYVAVWPPGQPSKSGPALTQDSARWPYVGSTVAGGTTWYCIRLDSTRVYSQAVPDAYCVDLNDNLFEPGDTICFFYCAESAVGIRTYAFCSNLTAQGVDINQAAANPSEFTCLPAGGWSHGGDILYVDGMDGRGAQLYFDTAFRDLGIFEMVDRYDVRGPTSAVGNRPGSRVKDINQLLDCYRKILWDTGDLSVGVGQGGGYPVPDKSPDYAMLNAFLGGLESQGGVYICGDDAPHALILSPDPQAASFRSTYITYTLTSSNHVAAGYGNSPLARGIAGRCFSGDTFFISGGSPMLNDFDVMTPTGASGMEVSYGVPGVNNGAVISKATVNSNAVSVGVLLSGFSFIYIRDDDLDGILDRADHLHDILNWLGNVVNQPTGTTPELHSSLDQNYPNPFNPTTTISFFVKQDSQVRLSIFDARGALVRALVNDQRKSGSHRVTWDGKNNAGQDAASGVYFYRLTAGDFTSTRKMVLLK